MNSVTSCRTSLDHRGVSRNPVGVIPQSGTLLKMRFYDAKNVLKNRPLTIDRSEPETRRFCVIFVIGVL